MSYVYAKLVSFTETEISEILASSESEWQRSLKAERDAILSALQTVFATQDDFKNIMLNRQLPAYQQYINPNHPKAAKAIARLKAKWQDVKTFNKFNANIQSAFAEGGDFEKGVDAAAADARWSSRVVAVLMVVGGRPKGISMAPKLMMMPVSYTHLTLPTN